MGTYDTSTGFFENRSKLEDLPVQSPIPLGQSFRYFVVTQQEVSLTDGKGASVGLATCSVRPIVIRKKTRNCFSIDFSL
jgi:hypothetical protein